MGRASFKGRANFKGVAKNLWPSPYPRGSRGKKEVRAVTLAEQIALVPGGFPVFMSWVEGASLRDKFLIPLLETLDQAPEEDRNAKKLEEIAFAIGVSPAEILASAVRIAFETHKSVATLMASLAVPDIVKTNIQQAIKPRGVEDRKMFMQSWGVLPVPRGSTFNVTAQAGVVTEDGRPTGLPAFEEHTVSFSEVIRNATETPRALPEPIDVDPEDE